MNVHQKLGSVWGCCCCLWFQWTFWGYKAHETSSSGLCDNTVSDSSEQQHREQQHHEWMVDDRANDKQTNTAAAVTSTLTNTAKHIHTEERKKRNTYEFELKENYKSIRSPIKIIWCSRVVSLMCDRYRR